MDSKTKEQKANCTKPSLDGEDVQDEGQELCPDCGNLMVKEGEGFVCSSCSETIDFLGEDEDKGSK